jgi:hypothetical protein
MSFSPKLEPASPAQEPGSYLPYAPGTSNRAREQAEKRLLRKLDTRVLPTVVLIYIMNYIDVRCTVEVSPRSLY